MREERDCQHLDGRIFVDELYYRTRKDQHHEYGSYYCCTHDRKIIGHPYRCNHGIQRKDDIDDQYLHYHRAKRNLCSWFDIKLALVPYNLLVNLLRSLVYEKDLSAIRIRSLPLKG